MPLISERHQVFPAWCELAAFEIVHLPVGARHVFSRREPQERLIVAAGSCRIGMGGRSVDASEGTKVELDPTGGAFVVDDVRTPVTLVRLSGSWGTELGGWGLFAVNEIADPVERGDPTDYPKRTNIDNHYHDCDEYWIIVEGRGEVVSEGKRYAVGPGDCLATGMGHHHDFPTAQEPVRAVYFETTLMGERRRGHLWDHTHGPAQPQSDRQ
jgi:mannose-6-phosphate isomerase-like protein (cupin superfamily)